MAVVGGSLYMYRSVTYDEKESVTKQYMNHINEVVSHWLLAFREHVVRWHIIIAAALWRRWPNVSLSCAP